MKKLQWQIVFLISIGYVLALIGLALVWQGQILAILGLVVLFISYVWSTAVTDFRKKIGI